MKRLFLGAIAIFTSLSLISCSHGEPDSLYSSEEVNQKLDIAQKSIGSLMGSLEDDGMNSKMLSNYGYTNSVPIYQYNPNGVASYINLQQQTIYIISIVDYIQSHLRDESYNAIFEYGKVIQGTGYMKTIDSLNKPLRENNAPKPVLNIKFTKEENAISVDCNWDYQSAFMKKNLEYWNMKILSRIKFVYDEEEKLKQIWVNYCFVGGLGFDCATSLLDYENETYYNIRIGNDTAAQIEFPDKKQITENIKYINEGKADSSHLVYCSHNQVSKSKLSEKVTLDDYSSYIRYVNRVDKNGIEDHVDRTSDPGEKEKFDALYDEVYEKLHTFSFLTDFNSVALTSNNELISDAADYALWRSTIVYDQTKNEVFIPFIEYSDLIEYLNNLSNGPLFDYQKELVMKVLEIAQANQTKYIGNKFVDGEDVYSLSLSGTYAPWIGNTIVHMARRGFSYILMRNDVKLFAFEIVDHKVIVH